MIQKKAEIQNNTYLLKKFEFLLDPISGYIMKFLEQGSHYDNFSVKKPMLQLLCKIFELKDNPFVRKKAFVNSFIIYFYSKFVQSYHSYVLDSPTIEMCQLYLRILLAFSASKNGMLIISSYFDTQTLQIA